MTAPTKWRAKLGWCIDGHDDDCPGVSGTGHTTCTCSCHDDLDDAWRAELEELL